MAKFEVTIDYKGTTTYFVNANTKEQAAEIAEAMFADGQEDHLAGSHTEEPYRIEATPAES